MEKLNTGIKKEIYTCEPAFDKDAVTIVFASDNNYAPYLGVVIKSLIENSSCENNYDIVVLETSISLHNKELIKNLIEERKNISIRFFNVSVFLQAKNFFTSRYLTIETYFRLFIPEIFTAYNKLIYLDCDIIILDDIANFYHTDITDYLIGATYNLSTLHSAIYNYNVFGVGFKDYCRKILKMDCPVDYFQAGVLLFNITKMKEQNIQERALKMVLSSYEYIMHDQDILNSLCYGQVKILSQQWDLFNHYSEENGSIYLINDFSQEIRKDYLKAKENPKIIHYAGPKKVWQHPEIEYAYYWWKYSQMTPFYEEIICRSINISQSRCCAAEKNKIKKSENLGLQLFKYEVLCKITTGNIKKKFKQKRKELRTKIINK